MDERARVRRDDSGQVAVLFAMLTLILIALMGLAADVGRLYVVRAELGRTVDAAALAGAKELPSLTNATQHAQDYINANEPGGNVTDTITPDAASQQVSVTASKKVDTIFMRVFGIKTMTVTNSATAGFGVIPVDAVMAIDATGSMGASPCNGQQSNSGCPEYEAKNAAKSFTNTLLPSANTSVGALPFRGCYNPPNTKGVPCVPANNGNMIVPLNNDAITVTNGINAISARGGTGTNVCGGLDRAAQVLYGSGSHAASNTIRVIVILTDAANIYNAASYVAGSSPAAACTPTTSPSTSDAYLGTACSAPGQGTPNAWNPGSYRTTPGRQLDTETVARADALKTQGVEIYVVNFGVCGTDDGTTPSASYCGNIGNADPDTIASQRLAKCIASSTSGTNDHYFRVDDPTALSGVFTKIAQNIAFRLIK